MAWTWVKVRIISVWSTWWRSFLGRVDLIHSGHPRAWVGWWAGPSSVQSELSLAAFQYKWHLLIFLLKFQKHRMPVTVITSLTLGTDEKFKGIADVCPCCLSWKNRDCSWTPFPLKAQAHNSEMTVCTTKVEVDWGLCSLGSGCWLCAQVCVCLGTSCEC